MSTPEVAKERPIDKPTVKINYDAVLAAIQHWQPHQLEMLIADLQMIAQTRAKTGEPGTDALAAVPQKKATLAEMMSIIPPDVVAPTDEEVEEILMQSRLERLDNGEQ